MADGAAMAVKKPFGRRPVSQHLSMATRLGASAPVVSSGALALGGETASSASTVAQSRHHDEELAAWKRARGIRIPWRQLSLMASLSFGIASLVLPDYVNAAVQWPLYALAAVSFYVWVSGPRSSPAAPEGAAPPPARGRGHEGDEVPDAHVPE